MEAGILAELREVTKENDLRQKDIMEWSNGAVKAREGEVLVHLPTLNVNVAYKPRVKK